MASGILCCVYVSGMFGNGSVCGEPYSGSSVGIACYLLTCGSPVCIVCIVLVIIIILIVDCDC